MVRFQCCSPTRSLLFLLKVCNTIYSRSLYEDSHYEISLVRTLIMKRIPSAWLIIRTRIRSPEILRTQSNTRANENADKGRNVAQSVSEIRGSACVSSPYALLRILRILMTHQSHHHHPSFSPHKIRFILPQCSGITKAKRKEYEGKKNVYFITV
jgi:predicted GTPase